MEYDNPELNCANDKIDERLTYGRIESARKGLAKVLNRLEGINMDIKSACSIAKWNDEVSLQVEEAVVQLGFALATLTTWDDDLEDEKSVD